MSTSATTTSQMEIADHVPTERERTQVFWEWCLRREAFSLMLQMQIVAPLVLAELYFYGSRPDRWFPNQGRAMSQVLFALAAMMIMGGGAIHAAQAICWEVASELRELVRLTGIGPIRLLVCKSLARWISIACSLMVLTPMVCFALTLSGATMTQLIAYVWGLFMLALLTASFAALAGVLSNASQNVGTTAAMSTFILMLLYHMLFWLSNLLIALGWSATGDCRFHNRFTDSAGQERNEQDTVSVDWNVSRQGPLHIQYIAGSTTSRISGHSRVWLVYVFLICLAALVGSIYWLCRLANQPIRRSAARRRR